MNLVLLALGFGIVTGTVLALGAVGFTLQFSISRIFNVAFAGVMTIAAYVAYFVNNVMGLNIWIAFLAAAGVASLLSVVIERWIYAPFLRRGSNAFALIMVSIAIMVIIADGLQAIVGPSYVSLVPSRGASIQLGGIIWTPRQIAVMAIAACAMLALHLVLRYTRLGKAIRAVADDPDLARTCGIDSRRITSITWGLSGILCGMSGVALALETVTFTTNIGLTFLLVIIAAALVGGVGHPYGAMLGALAIGFVTELTALVMPETKHAAALALLIVVMIFFPYGIRWRGKTRIEAAAA